MSQHSDNRQGIRKTALILTGIALAFYVGFIMMGVMQS
jgi:hypothetical protein